MMETTLTESPQASDTARQCPFCAEHIRKEALKCRYCGEFLDIAARLAPKKKWYHTNIAVIISLLTLGPLALPMIWVNPGYKLSTKIAITLGLIILTVGLCYIMVAMYVNLLEQIREL